MRLVALDREGAAVTPARRLLLLAPSAPLVAALVLPAGWESPVPLCLVKGLTGLDCPGCGSLRGVHDLLHGDWRGALGHNALLPLTLPLLGWLGGSWIAGRRPPVPNALAVSLLLVAVAFGVARNG